MKENIIMKYAGVFALFISIQCMGQGLEGEILGGFTGYKGDLVQGHFAFRSMRPATGFNLKFNIDNVVLIRGGVLYGELVGDDKYNRRRDLRARNLDFKTRLIEASLVAEYNLLEPEIFTAYPYIFGGVGIYHFDSYSYDSNGEKIYLQPLSTEGQGLAAYPNRKPYSRTQFCLPFGAGWKWQLSERLALVYEIGYRLLFTDYLDDVSTTYVDPQILLAEKGARAVEMAFRSDPASGSNVFPQKPGDKRGNESVNDWYYYSGLKLTMKFGKYL